MKIRFLLIGTSLSLIPQTINAQCVATQDCATLGYTETSCSGGTGVKCPFGNKWACFKSDSEVCQQYGFTQTCTGTGYSGGSGPACNGKYTACTCTSGYEWKDGAFQELLNGAKGNLYYCNGIVVGVKADGMNFYVAMKDLGATSWYGANSQSQNYTFCSNLKGVLPTKDQLVTLYNNKSTINSLLSINGGTKMTESFYWSSTDYITYNGYYYYRVNMANGGVDGNFYDASDISYVRPILTSW